MGIFSCIFLPTIFINKLSVLSLFESGAESRVYPLPCSLHFMMMPFLIKSAYLFINYDFGDSVTIVLSN
jgi:hypothetical protein